MIHLKKSLYYTIALILLLHSSCKKSNTDTSGSTDTSLSFTVDGIYNGTLTYHTGVNPILRFTFTEPINPATITTGIKLSNSTGSLTTVTTLLSEGDKTLTVTSPNDLSSFENYSIEINEGIKSAKGGKLINPVKINLSTGLNNTDKFPRITDDELLTLIQKQTFKYFYDFGHPISGLARERSTSGNTVTIGGSGFGIMALVTGIHRNFITRAEGLARMQKIVDFLKNKAQRFHGVYPHWLDGNTGVVQPFSTKDNGGDLVETSFLIQGLITARQYFTGTDAAETTLRNDITTIYNSVEWDWHRKDNGDVLYWHWSPNYAWEMNLPLRGWNEGLITYIMAAASSTHSIPKTVYDSGWAKNDAIKNGSSYFGIPLPLGSANGGPLFFSHYSFLGINPLGLTDSYANYETQNRAHTLINYNYCKANPKNYAGYSENCWGLTASDTPTGYSASSPNNDLGVIAPTAALSSFPYTPTESMQALKFFYYKLGDKLFKDYGFVDAFSLQDKWFDTQTLAIDQGPIIVMIENHRSKLLWNLFMSAPEVKSGLLKLGFTSPNL
ncbi:MAG: glucoamylase family protein [Candidatus Pedobacter colombiensis]|uniref:Glucoamylase family protein n=1 Tax=Candidatus Pedobacter colombiensis TaxID=3121371 RepID=A0AAJ5W7X7_9SPHI|nr:glucoamylase family protein [Pedobacter sp.]WEK18730.1 MAG: glucoamylase family protein [Pedobacter sp.]